MARRPRDYAAEYQRRVERARKFGFTGYRQQRELQESAKVTFRPRSKVWSPLSLARGLTVEEAEEQRRVLERRYPGEVQAGIQGPFAPSPSPDWDYYWPTRTINPPRPRTLSARYSQALERIEIVFREGMPYQYEGVSPEEWTQFKRVNSPGRYINAVLNGKDYRPGGWGHVVGE